MSTDGQTASAETGAVPFQSSRAHAEGHWDHECDVAVVGSGAAGFAAALTAREAGAEVLVLERAAACGGTTLKADGGVWIPNNARMREAGVADPRDAAIRYMARLAYPHLYNADAERLGLPENAHALIAAFYDNAAPAIDALAAMGALDAVHLPDPASMEELFPDYFALLPENEAPRGRCLVPQCPDGSLPLGFGGRELVRQLLEATERHAIPTLLEHRVARVVQDGAGRVVGLEATTASEETVTVRARRAVVFATGGFTHNAELCRTFLRGPIFGGCAAPEAEGDFVYVGTAAGAKLANMTNAWWGQVVLEDALASSSVPQSLWTTPGDSALQVNATGRRVMNEKFVYNERTQVHFAWDPVRGEYPNLLTFLIYDQRAADLYGDCPLSYPIHRKGDVPYTITAPTLEELAAGIEQRLLELAPRVGRVALHPAFAANLRDTIERFNAYAEGGVDPEFGRGETPIERTFHHYVALPKAIPNDHPNATMHPLAPQGPYHAVIVAPGVLDTKGGPAIDPDARILDAGDAPIPGLYGAGNCVGSPAGQAYWAGGGTLGPALTFGHIAGRNAAQEPEKDPDTRLAAAGQPAYQEEQ